MKREAFRVEPISSWLEKAGVPSGPINDFSQIFNDPHVQSRGMRVMSTIPSSPISP